MICYIFIFFLQKAIQGGRSGPTRARPPRPQKIIFTQSGRNTTGRNNMIMCSMTSLHSGIEEPARLLFARTPLPYVAVEVGVLPARRDSTPPAQQENDRCRGSAGRCSRSSSHICHGAYAPRGIAGRLVAP